jgi:hypothetical protein
MFQGLGGLVDDSIKRAGISRQVESSLVVEEANRIIKRLFGPKKAERIMAAWVKDKILTIACLNSSASQEANLFERAIINQVNNKFEKEVINDIRYIF